ncbi:MAG TPA: MFS transporter [Candidatus Acidoferrales bacterium]|nr:MFS transporter [Candidatus Acidoferrales bacterium]
MKSSTTTAAPETARGPASTLIHSGAVLSGMLTTLLGPLLPVLSARWSLDDAQAGYFFTAQFAGSMTGAAISGLLLPRRGFRFALVLGFALVAAGAVALGSGGWATGLLSVFVYGAGLGFTIACTNLWVSESNPEKRAQALNILNFAWGAGCVASPFLFAELLRRGHDGALLIALGVAFAIVAVALARIPFAEPKPVEEESDFAAARPGFWSFRFGPTLGAMFFLYVGAEIAVGGWVASHAQRVSVGTGTLWALAPAFFWGALVAGRALAPAALRHVSEARIVLGGLVLASLGVGGMLGAASLAKVLGAACLAGFGFSAIFPTLAAWIAPAFGASSARFGGRMFALGAMGGATVPSLVGFFSTHFGGLRAGLLAPLACNAIMLVLLLLTPPPAAKSPKISVPLEPF